MLLLEFLPKVTLKAQERPRKSKNCRKSGKNPEIRDNCFADIVLAPKQLKVIIDIFAQIVSENLKKAPK